MIIHTKKSAAFVATTLTLEVVFYVGYCVRITQSLMGQAPKEEKHIYNNYKEAFALYENLV